MKILLTICARKGSKGVKNKNIRFLLGKPLIAYSIDQALNWGRASHVVVSTDSKEIAEIAKSFGAEVPFIRPANLAQDRSPKLPVLRHALLECERIFQQKYDIIVDLDPTSPLRTSNDIEGCYSIFRLK